MNMKARLFIMLLLSSLALEAASRSANDRIVIISDTHLLSPELISPGSAIDHADAGETKMMAQSDAIMSAVIDSIIAIKPSLVLITGDLTHNGERLSHERMAWHLSRLTEEGIQPLVIPGNHDCNNPYAVRFDGDNTIPTPTITREEFAALYKDCGYNNSHRDPASLSYCCEPVKGVVVIAIDSNMDENNMMKSRGDSVDTYHNGGQIKPKTLQWVIEQASHARKQGKQVIAMMHHHLVSHFDQEDRLLANYIVKNHNDVAQQLLQAGIHIIFTGHLHVTDATTLYNSEHNDSIIEVATGSTICYPFALRIASIDRKHHTLDISTRWITATASSPTLREQGLQRILNSTPGMAAMLSGKAWSRFGGHINQLKSMLEMDGGTAHLPETPQQATQLVLRHLNGVLSRTLLAIVEGNEQDKDVESIIAEGKQGVRTMIDEVAPEQADALWEFFQNDVYPRIEPLARSILEDRNAVGTSNESHTDDLNLSVTL